MLHSCSRWPSRLLALGTLGVGLAIAPLFWQPADSQETPSQALTILADVQQANAVTGVITARGNVQLRYPARQIQATAAQAQYFSREGRIVLSGNVYVLQQGNSLRADTITYLIEEAKFVALPAPSRQVESILMIPDDPNQQILTPVQP
ncbi:MULTISPECIES: LptA/OstA family protein [unclassified Thermosynechococcus]|uniref:LptA/OstA family protein n=1 Tax=unclassified Thermosynechococcus TaxID=2622553 RepID=UPI002671D2AA|nr:MULTISPECIES: LptA/OstA family protein [unclassified Thermosynechococcus]MDR5638400.1 LptA/OstA family protein [Thermosynechococcus sp. PP42]MDR7897214.1 LptA/OstA family protein [Thermosynechococcus sp. JY1332]MDR7904612.1 LptA/OstA family protein [Thermosynechococcus sp. JY1334]MDR7921092.1 LptA/OstA family protein [Thermosynechococcus sp. HY213]MDR7992444.1 LptA/OstA family protein [Thermosynechococcus sp. TG252]